MQAPVPGRAATLLLLLATSRLVATKTASIVLSSSTFTLPPSRLRLTPSVLAYDAVRLVLMQRARNDARLLIGTRLRFYAVRALDVGGIAALEICLAVPPALGTGDRGHTHAGRAAAAASLRLFACCVASLALAPRMLPELWPPKSRINRW